MHVVGTAGHVDHGKSTLVKRLTGIDPDRFAEEKRRGLTIDLGFAWLRLPSGTEVGIVDVPGHERFIRNMLAGAGGVSVCLFVVAANEGWMPQSAEHLSILDVLGVRAGVVALTKADTIDEETLALASAEVTEEVARSTLRGAPIVACSAVSGLGIEALVGALDGVLSTAPPAPDFARPRLWIDRVFTIAGAGTVVTGTLAGGALAPGDEVEVAPRGRRARIRSVQTHKTDVARAEPGARVALNLVGLGRADAQRGDAIVLPGQYLPTRAIDARIRVLEARLSHTDHVLTERGAHLLYAGSAETPVRLRLLDAERIGPGESGFAQLRLRDPLPLARGDRFVLRDAGRVITFGGGEVLDPHPAPARRRDEARLELLRRLTSADAEAALVALVDAAGSMAAREALVRSGVSAVPEGVIALGPLVVSTQTFAALARRVRETLERYHVEHPLERGMPSASLRASTGLDQAVFEALLKSLPDVREDGAIVRAGDFSVRLAPDQQRARADLLKRIEAAGYAPPRRDELGADAALVRALVDAGDLVRIDDFFLTKEQAATARSVVRSAISERGPLTVAEIRDLLQTSRKYAVPLCEWLDASGATRRQGDRRSLGDA